MSAEIRKVLMNGDHNEIGGVQFFDAKGEKILEAGKQDSCRDKVKKYFLHDQASFFSHKLVNI